MCKVKTIFAIKQIRNKKRAGIQKDVGSYESFLIQQMEN